MEQRQAGKHKSKMVGSDPGDHHEESLLSSQKVCSALGIPRADFFFQLHYLILAEERAKLDALGEERQTGCMVM